MFRGVKAFFVRVKQILRRFKNKKFLAVFVLLLVVSAAGISYLVFKPTSPSELTKLNTLAEAKQLESKDAPKDDNDKINYYADIASRYEEAGEYQKALDAMLQADSYIKVRNGEKSRSVNNSIGRYYKQLGNTAKAKEYFDKEIKRLKTIPGNEATIQYYETQKADLDEN